MSDRYLNILYKRDNDDMVFRYETRIQIREGTEGHEIFTREWRVPPSVFAEGNEVIRRYAQTCVGLDYSKRAGVAICFFGN